MFGFLGSDGSIGLTLPSLSRKVSLSNLQLLLGYLKFSHISETRLIPAGRERSGRGRMVTYINVAVHNITVLYTTPGTLYAPTRNQFCVEHLAECQSDSMTRGAL